MESRHLVKNAQVSLRKVRALLPAVKKLSPSASVEYLRLMPQSAAKALYSAIQTALANAESALKVPKGMLEFRKLQADQGMTLKRFRAGSRGTAKPILRRNTHITVVLGAKQMPLEKPVAKPAEEMVKKEGEKEQTVTEKEEVKEKVAQKPAAPKRARKPRTVTKKDNS